MTGILRELTYDSQMYLFNAFCVLWMNHVFLHPFFLEDVLRGLGIVRSPSIPVILRLALTSPTIMVQLTVSIQPGLFDNSYIILPI